jgi:hypothetical protein
MCYALSSIRWILRSCSSRWRSSRFAASILAFEFASSTGKAVPPVDVSGCDSSLDIQVLCEVFATASAFNIYPSADGLA